jgi:hypothetical protein
VLKFVDFDVLKAVAQVAYEKECPLEYYEGSGLKSVGSIFQTFGAVQTIETLAFAFYASWMTSALAIPVAVLGLSTVNASCKLVDCLSPVQHDSLAHPKAEHDKAYPAPT